MQRLHRSARASLLPDVRVKWVNARLAVPDLRVQQRPAAGEESGGVEKA